MAPLTRILLTVFAVITMIIGVGVYLSAQDKDAPTSAQGQGEDVGQLVRDNSRRLTTVPNSDVAFVEFLDFECEACRAAFPMVEQLRAEYGDRVNFVIRYFPIQSHFNAERAARAVEAAAQQDKFEPMYKKMYETQSEWGEQQTPADSRFRGFAAELGLDMAAFDAAYNDPATLDRVNVDVADGKALGVKGTPTFFIDGTEVEFRSYDDLKAAVEQALNG
ncbi:MULTISPECIES: DsbA family protein [Mycolicibacterium]|jgi:protein-disulfide isomerase|uniref:Disulfide bond formation protein DsbA n=2 Tax=Mycolicibacterium TaxID=1866885 RepID=A0A1X1TGD5_9MYCO|nr:MULTISPECIES: thioredoxin domain-containing protein [Mycolicibacterium]MCV7270172.1 thioredoxin domain-containing protein [Mycolicibacterium doricum]MDA4102697.1 DSBA oxidoreductase [Mycolicibacterium monacense DSM 44395]OBB74398.1 thioredoxin [Mycolicibacterium monacense]OBF53982.1 thioredoxin [Mycolicibacterium monacense]ORB16402.1 thioredoxin [Mycolicibacterium monacense DSM 44395]